MAKFRKKPVAIEAITFDKLVELGRRSEGNNVNGMPWSFQYQGHSITHERDDCYLIPTLEGIMKMTPNDMLITGVSGEIYPCKCDIFAATYEPAIGSDNKEWGVILLEKLNERAPFKKPGLSVSESAYAILMEAVSRAMQSCQGVRQ